MTDLPVFELERVFEAPREMVWRTWTESELLARWYGPNVETVIHKLDVREGGVWLNEMRHGGGSNRERMDYVEVDPPARLVWLHSIADENWERGGNPQMPDWPRVLLTTVTFEDLGAQTRLRLTWAPHEASEAEIACFANALAGLSKGWSAGMAILEEVLAELMEASSSA